MFGKFDEETRKALTLAKKEMSLLRHPFVGSEHLLLGILSIKSSLTNKLKKYGLTYKLFKQELIKIIGIGKEKQEWFLYTPLLKKILERVVINSKDTNEEINLNGLFISLITEGEGVAYRILIGMGIDLDKLYKDITFSSKKKNKKLLIDELGIDLNKEVINNKIDPVVCRDNEVNRMIEILSRRSKNNPILVGNAGVGKTAIVEELARRIVNLDVPSSLLDKRIISLDMATVLSGTKYRGEFEDKLKKIINELINNPDIILFIDEIHTVMGAGSAEGAIDASNILKPFLARGKIKIIGSTTFTEYKKYIEKDRAFDRRFQKIIIEEPDKNNLKDILMNLKNIYESYHGVIIDEDIINEIINLSNRYIFDRCEPDRSIDILDEVCARVSLRTIKEEKDIIFINKELTKLSKDKKKYLNKENYKEACNIKNKEIDLIHKKEKLELEIIKKKKIKKVTKDDVKNVISKKSGVPITTKEDEIFKEIEKIKDGLHEKVIGQDKAIELLIEITKKIKLGIKDSNKSYSILFSGPTGVGKTSLAKKYASFLTNSIIKLDMNEYTLRESINKLIGSPAGYIGYDEDSNLLEKVRTNPYSILILDEIEKAHSSIINFFLNILDEGYCYDNKGNKIRFDNVLIIMTTNVYKNKDSIGFNSSTRDNLLESFSKEFLNRIDEIVEFNQLNESDINKIIYNELERYNKKNKCNINLTLEEIESIKENSNYKIYGARRLYRLVRKELDQRLVKVVFK
ncbi:MAG: ATP-dependent Clp protease ATP-binding subunit [Bacilli bacterium]|nr:ATP-dependent Clp protease ATP-binding subunit [Bacilli bacterium]